MHQPNTVTDTGEVPALIPGRRMGKGGCGVEGISKIRNTLFASREATRQAADRGDPDTSQYRQATQAGTTHIQITTWAP